MKRQHYAHLLVVLTLGAVTPCFAQSAALTATFNARPRIDRTITIDEAVTIALKESPVVRGAVAEANASVGRKVMAEAQRRPVLMANTFLSGGSNSSIVLPPAGAMSSNMAMGLPRGAFGDQNLALMMPLDLSGRLIALAKQAVATQAASNAELARQRLETALLVRTAYRDVLTRQEMLTIYQARRTESAERLRLDRERLAAESVPLLAVRRGEADLAEAEQEVTNAERDVAIALLQLKTVMGIDADSTLTLSAITEATDNLSTDLSALRTLAELNRPELQAAMARVSSATAARSATERGYRPQANLFAMGDISRMSGERTFAGTTYGVAVSVPLFTSGQKQADVQTMTAMQERERIGQEQVALQVEQEVRIALLNLRAAQRNVTTAEAARTAAEEENRLARLRYEAGRSVLSEVLESQTAFVRAQSNLVIARLQVGMAWDQLHRAVGK